MLATLKAISEGIKTVWAYGALLLWCMTTICVVILVILVIGARLGIGDYSALLVTYGTWLSIALVALLIAAVFKTYAERKPPILSIIPDERQSFWSQAKQNDGRTTTQISVRFQVTNFDKSMMKLSTVRLYRPWVRRKWITLADVSTKHPTGSMYSSQHPVFPNSLSHGLIMVMIDRAVGRKGKEMRVVVGMQDHAGRWHKLVVPHLRST